MSYIRHQCLGCGYAIVNNKVGPLYCPNCNAKMNRFFSEHDDYSCEEEYDNDDNYFDYYEE